MFNPESINALNVFLTIVVGFLGTSGGFFFSGEALKHLERKVTSRGKILSSIKAEFLDYLKRIGLQKEFKTFKLAKSYIG